MKKTKILLTLVCAILLVAASVMGTLAYLTSTPDAVVNTFTVGANVEITLDEAKTNELGQKLNNSNGVYNESDTNQTLAARVAGNEYKLLPGHEYVKDPTVHVRGGDCYVFITVDNAISNVEDSTNTIASQITTNNWVAVEGYSNLYVYVGDNTDKSPKAVSGTAETPTDLLVFSKFKIDSTETHDDLKSFNKTDDQGTNKETPPSITIKAYAIQTDGMPTDAKDIWTKAAPSTGNLAKETATSGDEGGTT